MSAENNVIKAVNIYPERGYIYDRNGILLVSNQNLKSTYVLTGGPQIVLIQILVKFTTEIFILKLYRNSLLEIATGNFRKIYSKLLLVIF